MINRDIRTTRSELRKAGIPIKLAQREEANAITAYCFRNMELEEYHSQGKIKQPEMKPTMIEASARIDYLLTEKQFFRLSGTKIFRFAFRKAFENNCEGNLTKTEWLKLEKESCAHLESMRAVRRFSKARYETALTCYWLLYAKEWDTTIRFDGINLISEKI